MSFSPDLSVTGAAIAAFTTPVFTLVADTPPEANSRQWYTSAISGTGTSTARVHTAPDPFTILIRKAPYKALPPKNPVNGSYGNVPLNRIEILCRKGVYIDSANTLRIASFRLIADLPAGCELADSVNIKAAVSNLLGLMAEESSDYADSLIAGVI